MKILAYAATTSRHSINKQLIGFAVKLMQEGLVADCEIEIIDILDYELPLYSVDREQEEGIPAKAKAFFDKIGAADALLISYAEHNGYYTAAYKNLFDWASRIDMKVYQEKPVVKFATSPGRGGGANVLKTAVESAPHFGASVKAQFSLPSFNHNFDKDKAVITDSELLAALKEALAAFNS